MEIKFEECELENNLISFDINESQLIGITGNSKLDILKLIMLKIKKKSKGKIYIDDEELTKENITYYQKKITFVKKDIIFANFLETVNDLMLYGVKRQNIKLINPQKKIIDSLKIVGLNPDILTRKIHTLSTSEKKIISLAKALLSNPSVIILEEPFMNLDLKNEKKLLMLLEKIKEQYKKTIIFLSDDSNLLYKYTSKMIIVRNSKLIFEGNTFEVFKRVDFLKRNKVEIPKIVELTYLAKKKKNIKIDYHKDIRDIIKDIYKHV